MSPQAAAELQRTVLFQTEQFEVVSILWPEGVTSPMHNHGWSQCHVSIQEGQFENTLRAGAKTEVRVLREGEVISTPVGAAHELKCLSKSGKTLHVYTPKIKALRESEVRFRPEPAEAPWAELQLGKAVDFETLSGLLTAIQDRSVSTHSPYFMNQLFSGVHPQSLASGELIARTKTTMATREASPVFSQVEEEVVERLGEVIGYEPGRRDGLCVPGGSAANFMALQLARHRAFPELKALGLGGKKFRIFVSSHAHYSFLKAASAMGFGTDSVIKIEVDSLGRMEVGALREAIEAEARRGNSPLLVCATAGTTVFGAFDPIVEIRKLCDEKLLWLHVDAAWGGPVLFSEKNRKLAEGIELADSVAFDAHKLLGASLTCSFILTNHRDLLLYANDVAGGGYLFHEEEDSIDLGRSSWQCGRSAEALSIWSIWKNLGSAGMGSFVDRLFAVRDESLDWIRSQSRLEIVMPPSYLNLCVRILPPDGKKDPSWSVRVRQALIERNLAMVNYSADSSGSFLRLIFAHPQISASHVREILKSALEVS